MEIFASLDQLALTAGAAGTVVGENCSVITGPDNDLPVDGPSAGFVAAEYCAVNRSYPDPGRPGRPGVTVQYPVYALYPVGSTDYPRPGGDYNGPRRSVDCPEAGKTHPEVRVTETEAEKEAAVGM